VSISGLPFGRGRRRRPPSDYDYRDGDPNVPQVDRWALTYVDSLLEAAESPDHHHQLKTCLDRLFLDLGSSARQGTVAVLDRYLWCYQVLQRRGVEPGSPDFLSLAGLAYASFDEIVSAPRELLTALISVPFTGENEQTRELTIGQRILLSTAAVASLESVFGDEIAEEVRRSVSSMDWCATENGRLTSVDPAARTSWVDRCRD
jgi:hypothetical protein